MVSARKLFIYFNSLPQPIRYSTYFYISSILFYNTTATYINGKNGLNKFRSNQYDDDYLKKIIKTELSAIKYEINNKFCETFFNSIIWPFKIITDTIPYFILALNPPQKK